MYASDDDDLFADDDGVQYQEDTRTAVIVEFGFLFWEIVENGVVSLTRQLPHQGKEALLLARL